MYRRSPLILAVILSACAPTLLPLELPTETDGAPLATLPDGAVPDAVLRTPDEGVAADTFRPDDAGTPDAPAADTPLPTDTVRVDVPPPPVDRPPPPVDVGTPCPVCNVPQHATGTCTGGRCGWACLPGWGDCDGQPINGCETDTRTAWGHCGGCGTACAADAVCTGGVCGCTAPAATVCGVACLDLTVTRSRCLFCARYCFPTPGSTRPDCCPDACRGC